MSAKPTSKTFGKSTREVPASSEKAKKWYPADDDAENKKVRKAVRSWAPRKSLQPGTVLILLAGRFRGKRVILLKSLDQGVLLVTGPFKINGVPLRRVNSRYVIATSYKVDISGLDEKKIEEVSQPKYFTAEKAKEKAGEEAFFKQGEKPQVRSNKPRTELAKYHVTDSSLQKKEVNSSRAADQKAIDKALIANIKKVDMLASYLSSSFSLRKGDKPHEMAW
ncbi:50S ribosomal L6e protein [Fusarium pseudocircinatum]|uniref:60S ribosomal protein L6 n=1 Tax=Fusarium pseudocircinatum TaxID=56676 RepID=A0A8H5L3F5_9HYPO|nr:50S ribosomal L6e protein [Fusarium pseudocircinatum]